MFMKEITRNMNNCSRNKNNNIFSDWNNLFLNISGTIIHISAHFFHKYYSSYSNFFPLSAPAALFPFHFFILSFFHSYFCPISFCAGH